LQLAEGRRNKEFITHFLRLFRGFGMAAGHGLGGLRRDGLDGVGHAGFTCLAFWAAFLDCEGCDGNYPQNA